jgi:urate oxidase / 2-oxo-4-hydroxy-4-carboxy-5-ureidoimidazoline decarboxylase
MANAVAIGYGKDAVGVYRTDGVRSLFAADVRLVASGESFLPSYTEGDNALVVATDSMKNFIHRAALDYDGTSLEDFLDLIGTRFLDTYDHVDRVSLRAREIPFLRHGAALFQRVYDDYGVAELELGRAGILGHRSGREAMHLIKLTGSAFAGFYRDDYTTLPETEDRPLFVHLDAHWRTQDVRKRPPSEEVRDSIVGTFEDFVSESIQHLVYEMGTRVLEQFQEIEEVTFAGENRLWDATLQAETDPPARVYTDARPPFGVIGLTLSR